MKQNASVPSPLPAYAIGLLLAAKSAHHGGDMSRLGGAIGRFEREMPLAPDGEIFVASPLVPLSELAIPVPRSVARLLEAVRDLLDNEAGARKRL